MVVGIAIVIVLLISCRYMPGPKCMTYCKFRQFVYKGAKNKLKSLCVDNNNTVTADFSSLTNEQLIKIWTNTTPYSCSSLSKEETLIVKARILLQEEIAERHLLDIE